MGRRGPKPTDDKLKKSGLIAFRIDHRYTTALAELGLLFAQATGLPRPLGLSETIRTCISFTYGRRKTIMMARLKHYRKQMELQCQTNQQNPAQQSQSPGSPNPEQQSAQCPIGKIAAELYAPALTRPTTMDDSST